MRDLVERYLGPPAKTSGEWVFWLCPKHQETRPSFGIKGGRAFCFSCKKSWNAYWFLRDIGGLSKEMAFKCAEPDRLPVVTRPKWAPLELPPLPPSLEWQQTWLPHIERAAHLLSIEVGIRGQRELLKRGISRETWERYKVGWNPEWIECDGDRLAAGLIFPAFVEGALWSFNVRVKGGKPKYCRNKTGVKKVLFGLEQLRGHDTLVIVEGEPDCLAAAQFVGDVADVIAIRGASNKLVDWMEWIEPYPRVIVCMDGDRAGIDAAETILATYPHWENRQPPESDDDLGKMYQAGHDIRAFLLKGWKL